MARLVACLERVVPLQRHRVAQGRQIRNVKNGKTAPHPHPGAENVTKLLCIRGIASLRIYRRRELSARGWVGNLLTQAKTMRVP